MEKGKVRIKHNKKLLVFIIILLFLVVILAFLIPKNQVNEENICKINSDCVKQQVTCCSCNMGGREECMTKGEAKEEQEKLGECEQNLLCIAVYNCQDTSCKCVNGGCVEEGELR